VFVHPHSRCSVLGGLLSTHLLLADRNISIAWYDGQLLRMAVDLADVCIEACCISNSNFLVLFFGVFFFVIGIGF
jgi:hypothetical protein